MSSKLNISVRKGNIKGGDTGHILNLVKAVRTGLMLGKLKAIGGHQTEDQKKESASLKAQLRSLHLESGDIAFIGKGLLTGEMKEGDPEVAVGGREVRRRGGPIEGGPDHL